MAEPVPFEEKGALQRHSANPLLTTADVPYPCSLIFYAGVTKFKGRYVMVFRNDYGPRTGSPKASSEGPMWRTVCRGPASCLRAFAARFQALLTSLARGRKSL